LLDSYEAERLPVARHVLELSTRLAATTLSSKTQGLIARTEDTSQLGISYRESPLAHELRSAPGSLRAGDRAPDVPGLVDREGRSLRLFDVFRGPQATLLAFGEGWGPVLDVGLAAAAGVHAVRVLSPGIAVPEDGGVPTLVDSLNHASAIWEPGTEALFAVRPDGVIGFADDRRDPVALVTWLRMAGLAR